jgi:hypothetical protein
MLLANPLHSAETNWIEEPKDALLPQLRRASDLIFAYSLRNNPDPKNLKYYIANNVQNAQTLPVIASILKNKGLTAAPEWPGVTLSAWEGNEVEALLGITFHIDPKNHHSFLLNILIPCRVGSPIGATLGHMLVQQKRELGRKHVAQVFLFRDQKKATGKDSPALQLVYKVQNVPEPQPEKPSEKQVDEEKLDGQGHWAIRVRQVVRREEGERMLRVNEFRLRRDGKV